MRISDWSSDVCSSDLVVGAYRTVRKELAAYGGGLEAKAEVVGLNKADALDKDSRREKQAALEQASGAKVICLSGVSGEGVGTVVARLWPYIAAERRRGTAAGEAPQTGGGGVQPCAACAARPEDGSVWKGVVKS